MSGSVNENHHSNAIGSQHPNTALEWGLRNLKLYCIQFNLFIFAQLTQIIICHPQMYNGSSCSSWKAFGAHCACSLQHTCTIDKWHSSHRRACQRTRGIFYTWVCLHCLLESCSDMVTVLLLLTRQRREHHMFNALLKMVPSLEEYLMNLLEEKVCMIADLACPHSHSLSDTFANITVLASEGCHRCQVRWHKKLEEHHDWLDNTLQTVIVSSHCTKFQVGLRFPPQNNRCVVVSHCAWLVWSWVHIIVFFINILK